MPKRVTFEEKTVATNITIKNKHHRFLEKHKLNLSGMVQNMLDQLMTSSK